jgi:hypothetical protein
VAAAQLRAVRRPVGVDVLGDLPCLKCGYNQRGLDSSAVCPECGTPVRDSIGSTPEIRDAADAVAHAAGFYGNGHRLTAAFALCLLGDTCCGVVMSGAGIVIVLVGCAQRLIGLVWLRRAMQRVTPDATDHGLTSAMVASVWESTVGLIVFAGVFFGLFNLLPGIAATYGHVIVSAAWAGTLGFGMISSAMLSESLERRFGLRVLPSLLPVRLAIAAPLAYLVFLAVLGVHGHFNTGATVAAVWLFFALGGATWALAAWTAQAYMAGTSDLLHGYTARQRRATPVRVQDIAPREARTDGERAAKHDREDDSPIPLD